MFSYIFALFCCLSPSSHLRRNRLCSFYFPNSPITAAEAFHSESSRAKPVHIFSSCASSLGNFASHVCSLLPHMQKFFLRSICKNPPQMQKQTNLEDKQAYIPPTSANTIFPEKNPGSLHRERLMTPHPNTELRFSARRRLEYRSLGNTGSFVP